MRRLDIVYICIYLVENNKWESTFFDGLKNNYSFSRLAINPIVNEIASAFSASFTVRISLRRCF